MGSWNHWGGMMWGWWVIPGMAAATLAWFFGHSNPVPVLEGSAPRVLRERVAEEEIDEMEYRECRGTLRDES